MSNVEDIPLEELFEDKEKSIEDIEVCKWALCIDVTEYGNGRSVKERLDANVRIIKIIDKEIQRRQNEI